MARASSHTARSAGCRRPASAVCDAFVAVRGRPVATGELRAFTIAVIVAGYAAAIYAVGGFIQLVTEGEINRALGARRMTRGIEKLRNHTILCGYGRGGRILGESLAASGAPFVVVDRCYLPAVRPPGAPRPTPGACLSGALRPMSAKTPDRPARFGSVLGRAPGDVPVYSSDYDTADEREFPDRHAFRNYQDGVYLGYKWQCVEFARRWLYHTRGYVFDDVAMAHEIFRLRQVRVVGSDAVLPLRSFRNGSKRLPEPGCLLVWDAGGEFEVTGHVAVVTEVLPQCIRFAEQNVGHRPWPEGRRWAREIKARLTDEGEYWVECSFGDATILGWVIQTDDDEHAEKIPDVDPRLFELRLGEVEAHGQARSSWLNVANPDEAAYVAMMGGHELTSVEADQYKYFTLSETAHDELERATNELHALFLHATDFVLQDDALLARFELPRALWPRIHQSWNNRRNQMITGRLDFSVSERGIKLYEYNADSAACHMECGKVQGKWARHFGCDVGRDPGAHLQERLAEAWRESDVDGVLHLMTDRDLEETYHALFMKEALEAAGIECKVLEGLSGLSWNREGDVLDPDGVRIRWVWKTWAWETALDQIRAECEDDDASLPGSPRRHPPRLVDVLLRPDVMVYEPLWTLIPSNKAILPVLWTLFPNHPYLLHSSFEPNETLREKGYVSKPIVGRCGANIRIFDRGEALLEETSGAFEDRRLVHQEFFPLPRIDGYNVQVSTFTAAGSYAGSCVRVDRSLVISGQSDNMALRIVSDREAMALERAPGRSSGTR